MILSRTRLKKLRPKDGDTFSLHGRKLKKRLENLWSSADNRNESEQMEFWFIYNLKQEEKKMEEVIQILMRRDGLTRTEAIAEIDDFREEAYALMEEGAYDEVEDLLIDYLGLEPDYLTSLLW